MQDNKVIAASVTEPVKFETLFTKYAPSILRYLRSRAGDAAGDLLSETFIVAFDKRQQYDHTQPSAKAWLFGIATNILRRHYRDASRQNTAYAKLPVEDSIEPDHAIEIINTVNAHQQLEALRPALARLTPTEYQILTLYAWADLSYREIAATMQLPLGTVKSTLSRVRKTLTKVDTQNTTNLRGTA